MITCRICVAQRGLKLDGSRAPLFDTDEEFMDHLEMAHGLIVPRDDETIEEATARVTARIPGYGTPDCQCEMCKGGGIHTR